MNDVERELRELLERKAVSVGGVAPRLPEAVRKRSRRRQAGTATVGAFTVAAVALVSFAGLRSIDRGEADGRVPADDPWAGYEVFERTATIETLTITSPSDWYLVNQWPLGAQVATSAESSSTSCVTHAGPEVPDVEVCSGVTSPVQVPVTDAPPSPLMLLSNADPGLGTSPCLDGGIEVAGDTAVFEIAIDSQAVQQIETGAGPNLPAWPVAFDEDAVTDGPCGSGHYVRFKVGRYPYIAWIGFGPGTSDDVRRALFSMAGEMRVEDEFFLLGPSDDTPGYVIAGGENAAGPWRLELRPSTSEGPNANVDLHLIGSEGVGPGVADFGVPETTPIESGGGDPTFGVVTTEATGVELRLEEGTPPIPATLAPLPPSLSYPFDTFFASNPSDVPATAVAIGVSDVEQPSPPPDEAPTPNEEAQLHEIVVTQGDGWRLAFEGTAESTGLIWFIEKGTDPYAPLPVRPLEPGQLGRWQISSAEDRLLLFGTVGYGAVSVTFEPDGAPSMTVDPVSLPVAGASAFGLLYDGVIQGETGAQPGGTLISYGSDGRELDRRRVPGLS